MTHALPSVPEVEYGTGYRLVHQSNGLPVLILGTWSAEVERVLDANPAVAIRVEERFDLLDRLVPFADRIRALIVAEGFAGRLEAVNRLAQLESLDLECAAKGVDLSSFPRLRKCALTAVGEVAGMAAVGELEELALERGRVETLRGLTPLRRLRKLYLHGMSRLVSLEGIEGLPIEELTVIAARALRSVGAAASLPRLRTLRLEGVRAVEDLERVAATESLEELALDSGPALPGYGFLRALPGLRRLAIGATPVAPGDEGLSPVEALTELRELHLESGLKHLGELDGLARLTHLESLSIDDAGEVRSIGFVRSLTALRSLWIRRTRIADRDLSPLLGLKALREVRIAPQHKRYAPSVDEVLAAVRANHLEFYLAREQRIQEARSIVNPHAHTATARAPAIRMPRTAAPGVLAGLPWRLDEEVSGRVEAVRRARDAVEGWNADEVVVLSSRLRLHVAEISDEPLVELTSDGAEGFSAGELLFKVHQAIGPFVRDTDYRYFEGLVPTGGFSADGVSLFDVRLGS